MINIRFEPIRLDDHAKVAQLIKELYAEDSDTAVVMTMKKIARTFARLVSHPDAVQIQVFKQGSSIVGYALLSNYWSNEQGGQILIIDELYVAPEFRGRGIGGLFIQGQMDQTDKWKGIIMGVLPDNQAAFRLYKRMGLEVIKTIQMFKAF